MKEKKPLTDKQKHDVEILLEETTKLMDDIEDIYEIFQKIQTGNAIAAQRMRVKTIEMGKDLIVYRKNTTKNMKYVKTYLRNQKTQNKTL